MGLKRMLKRVVELPREKEVVAVPHVVEESKILDGKVAVILGGTGGLGQAITKSLCESGCKVVLCGTNESKLKKLATGENIHPLQFNVSDYDRMASNVEKAVAVYGKVDIVIYSAGVHTENVDFFTMTPEEYDRVMNINLKGAYFVCQAFGKYMMKHKVHGHICLISSSRGSEPAWSPYGISKWGMNGLTKGLAQMFMPHGIVVNAIAPGSTATELIGIKEGDNLYSNENDAHRLIMPDEVANIAKVLVSSAGDMISGEVVHVSAGRGCFDVR